MSSQASFSMNIDLFNVEYSLRLCKTSWVFVDEWTVERQNDVPFRISVNLTSFLESRVDQAEVMAIKPSLRGPSWAMAVSKFVWI